MLPNRQGTIRLFRLAGVTVFLHWTWFLVAAIEIGDRAKSYTSLTWNVLEYLSLFVIVTIHEFGHALACRQVGGQASQIVLWPLGGVAYVDPPPRPGAMLWSIAAGPLVNVILMVPLTALWVLSRTQGWPETMPNVYGWVFTVWCLNLGLFIFNVLPIYPLDGGQILRSLLWFWLGRARSLMVATLIGFAGVAALILLAVWWQSVWIGALSIFILVNCWRGWQAARAMMRLADTPRHQGFACPSCDEAPPIGEFWICGRCRKAFDTFVTKATCPHCRMEFQVTKCLNCGALHAMGAWAVASPSRVTAAR